MLAERFSAGAWSKVVGLDVVSFGACSVVMADLLHDGMPRIRLGHWCTSPYVARLGSGHVRTVGKPMALDKSSKLEMWAMVRETGC